MTLWPQARLSILIYHRILAQPDALFPGEVDAKLFERHLRLLKRFFNVMPLSEAVQHLRNRRLPARAACITFDDGYADNAELALPLLQKHGLKACFFISTAYLNGGQMWNDSVIERVRHASGRQLDLSACGLGRFAIGSNTLKQQAIAAILDQLKYLPFEQRQELVGHVCAPQNSWTGSTLPGANLGIELKLAARTELMMTTAQVQALHGAGMEIGAHTARHPILSTLSNHAARAEIRDGKRALESMIDAPVRLFAYPNGKPGQDFGPSHVDIAKELGFDAAVATHWGAADYDSDPYQLPRFTPWDRGRLRFLFRMRQNMVRD